MSETGTKKLSKTWGKVTQLVEEGLKTGKDELRRTSKIGRLKLEISALKSQRQTKITELGEKVYTQWQMNIDEFEKVEPVLLEIASLEKEVANKIAKIAIILSERK